MRRVAIGSLLAAATACGTPAVGLQPVAPPIERPWYASTPSFTAVESTTPELRWQARPAIEGASELSYELRIWEHQLGDVGPLVYRREGLVEPRHRVEGGLFPGTDYLWSVRAHFTLEGEHRVTPWGQFGELLTATTVPNGSCFRFRTPAVLDDDAT